MFNQGTWQRVYAADSPSSLRVPRVQTAPLPTVKTVARASGRGAKPGAPGPKVREKETQAPRYDGESAPSVRCIHTMRVSS